MTIIFPLKFYTNFYHIKQFYQKHNMDHSILLNL